MKKFTIALTTAAALLFAPAVYAKDKLSGEEKLAKILEGREAGRPVDCLPHSANSDIRVIDKTAIVYGRGNTVWVNRPTNAKNLDDDNIMVRSSHTARICKLDTIRLLDQTSRMSAGFVGLNEFVPYRRVALTN